MNLEVEELSELLERNDLKMNEEQVNMLLINKIMFISLCLTLYYYY